MASNMTRLARGTVRQHIRPVGSVRIAGMGAFKGAEGKQLLYTQNIPPNHETSIDSSIYPCVDFRNSTKKSLERPLILQRPESDLSIEAVQRELEDTSLQALSPEKEEIFRSQLSKIWEGMKTLGRTAEWSDIILSRKDDEWLSQITKYIPADVKLILVSEHPPTPSRLMSLPRPNTTDGGVFAWCTEPHRKEDFTDKTLHVYIGSASKYPGGLNFRKSNMLSRLTTPHDEALKRRIKDLGLNSDGEFKSLFIVPFKNDVMDVRELVVVARFVLMIWLGAVDGRLKTGTRDLCPWRPKKIKYTGLAKDNPLMTCLNKSGRAKKKIAKGRNKGRLMGFKGKLSMV